ncbi:MAG: TIGR03086 family protein [Propionibacteriales bacterium]|nr:TIGR03086 family protein [Propionibacteriales bacterium]
MPALIDLEPASRRMASLLAGVTDEQLTAATPCTEYTLGDLVDHVNGLSLAFTMAAKKDLGPELSEAPAPDAARLGADWHTRIPEQLAALAEAWRDPAAWEGETRAGGVDLSGDAAGMVALNELVIHGWDVARASGQPFEADPEALETCIGWVSLFSGPGQEELRGDAFGPVVDVPADAPMLDRLVALAGRDPAWAAP